MAISLKEVAPSSFTAAEKQPLEIVRVHHGKRDVKVLLE
jgi:hypothetical protein